MCIHCTHRSAVILSSLFSRESGMLANFALPPALTHDAASDGDHRRAIGVIGTLMSAFTPLLALEARGAPQSVTERALEDATATIKALYDGTTVVDGRDVSRAAVLSHAMLAAMYYADTLLFAARHIEELMRAQAAETGENGPRIMAEQLARIRADITRRCGTEVSADAAENFPADMPEEVREVIRRMQRAGLQPHEVHVVAPSGADARGPIGTGPDGKLH